MIRDPRYKPGRTAAFAELIDIYKTLSELAGTPAPEDGVQGSSVANVVRNGGQGGKKAAFSQMARCFGGKGGVGDNYTSWSQPDACTLAMPDKIEFMGYSVRTADWRYTEWVEWNGNELRPNWAKLNATELYTHTPVAGHDVNDFDHWENVNLAGNSAYAGVMEELSAFMRAHVEANLPPGGPARVGAAFM